MIKFNKDSLKKKQKPTKTKLVNFRIDEELAKDFNGFCKNDLKNKMSDVLRTMMKDLLAQNGYKKYKT